MAKPKKDILHRCDWTQDEDGNYDTACNNKHIFICGGPRDNQHVYCPYCGDRIREHAFVDRSA